MHPRSQGVIVQKIDRSDRVTVGTVVPPGGEHDTCGFSVVKLSLLMTADSVVGTALALYDNIGPSHRPLTFAV